MAVSRDSIREILSEVISELGSVKGSMVMPIFMGSSSDQDIVSWLEEFEMRSSAHKWDESTMFRKLPLYLGNFARDWYMVYVKNGGENAPVDYSSVKELMMKYFLPSNYDKFVRAQLYERVQRAQEKVTEYVISKQALCMKVNPKMPENEVMERIVEGLCVEISRDVLVHKSKNLIELIELVKKIEEANNLLNVNKAYISKDNSEISELRKDMEIMAKGMSEIIKETRELNLIQNKTFCGSNFMVDNNSFRYCNTNFTIRDRTKCFGCGKIGHLARMCPHKDHRAHWDRNKDQIFKDRAQWRGDRTLPQKNTSTNSKTDFLEIGKLMEMKARVCNRDVVACLDTGSIVTMANELIFKDKSEISSYIGPSIVSSNGNLYNVIGQTMTEIKVKGQPG